jgi:acetate kinase
VRDRWPDVPQYAVFDTSFHRTLPPTAATYAVPTDLARRHGIRRWGFHGISHQHVTHVSAAWLQIPLSAVRLVICHIGNGVSITAVRDGQSIETSMGFTPLEGAVMGSRSGDVDPAMVPFLVREAGLSVDDVEGLLLRDSGLKGLCGDSDMRRVRARAVGGDEAARLALNVYAHRLRGYVGAYLAHLPEPHALLFTAGVGENDPALREEVVGPLGHLGLRIDPQRNNSTVGPTQPTRVDDGHGPIPVLVVPTDEALEIATQVRSALLGPVAE